MYPTFMPLFPLYFSTPHPQPRQMVVSLQVPEHRQLHICVVVEFSGPGNNLGNIWGTDPNSSQLVGYPGETVAGKQINWAATFFFPTGSPSTSHLTTLMLSIPISKAGTLTSVLPMTQGSGRPTWDKEPPC